eukprot:TRINITY_DN1144_c0_g1_i2.p1 TRINITY_DN1144_c0_g1~~TRINITY_DN1144_c0_g1_i2.p1  ORF type:complete len:222 (+),score=77.64 TRINITY_DN1144_c0_g1_i2:77-742(+)
MAGRTLKTVVMMGSARTTTPPWGGDKRLGDRVLKWVLSTLDSRTGYGGVKHEVTCMDPVEVFGPDGALSSSGAEMRTPAFFLKPDAQPPAMQKMQEAIKAADCYVIVTAEYNHSVPPALSSMLGHFGGSNYAYKPSAIVTYSPSPFGGIRAAMALRPLLSELGCLPVSRLAGYPMAADIFNEDGSPKDPANRMLKQLPSMLDQLEWTAAALLAQKEVLPPP